MAWMPLSDLIDLMPGFIIASSYISVLYLLGHRMKPGASLAESFPQPSLQTA